MMRVALLVAAALLLASCGGSSSTTSQGSGAGSASGAGSTPGSKPLPGHPKIATGPARRFGGSESSGRYPGLTRAGAKAAERRAKGRQRAKLRRLARKAGKAAPFLVPVGDNSIPTYGSQAAESQQAAATAALSAYLQARASGDWSGACAQMAATVRKQLALLAGGSGGASSCAAAYAKLASRIPASARANPLSGGLTALRVKEGKAFALFYGPKRQQYMMPMVSEAGAWKVNQLEPIPWPIGSTVAHP